MKELIKGVKPKVEHVYDLNVFELLDKMKTFYEEYSKPEELISRLDFLDESLKAILKRYEGMKPTDSFNLARGQLILPSSDDLFHFFLAYKLLTFDPYRIQAVLSYHSVLFQGNIYAVKGNFVGLVEYFVYGHVKSHISNNEDIRLDKIATWVEINRRIELHKANFSKRVKFDGELASILSEKLKMYVNETDETKLFNSLFEDKYSGEKIKFNCEAIELTLLFKELKRKKRLSVKSNLVLSQWICERFNVLANKNRTLNQKTILDYLNRESSENANKSRIYKDIF